MQSYSVNVLVAQDECASVAEIHLGDMVATGSSKRCPGDVTDFQVGHDLAVSRALYKLSQKLARKHGYELE